VGGFPQVVYLVLTTTLYIARLPIY